MLNHDQAEALIKAATFRLHLGFQRINGVRTECFGTGFFVGSDGLALTATHNFDRRPGDRPFVADYKGSTIEFRWIKRQSSGKNRADIAVMRLHAKPASLEIDGLRVAYLPPGSTLALRKSFFKDKSQVTIYGYPQRAGGGVGARIDGMVDTGKPIDDVILDVAAVERLCIRGSRITALEGISGAAMFDRDAGYVFAVETSYDCYQTMGNTDRTVSGSYGQPGKVVIRQELWRGSDVVHGSEIAGLVAEHPELSPHFELIVLPIDAPPPPSPAPIVDAAYLEWLKQGCASIELLGLTVRTGLSFKIGNVYVPLTTTGAEADGGLDRGERGPEPPRTERAVEFSNRNRDAPALLLHRLAESSLYVPGDPGCGKSTFCRWVAWVACEGRMPAPDVEPPEVLRERLPPSLLRRLPLLVPLREFWADLPRGADGLRFGRQELECTLARWIGRQDAPGLNESQAKAHLERGNVLMILDGLDEVPPAARGVLLTALSRAVRVWHERGHRLLVTSRPYGLTRADVGRLSLPVAAIQPLTKDVKQLLVRRWFRILEDTAEAAERTAADLLAEIQRRDYLQEFARNPLLLTAACVVYGQGKRLPQNRHELYHEIISTVVHCRVLDESRRQRVYGRLVAVAYGMHTGTWLGESRPTPQYDVTHAEIDRILRSWLRLESRTEAEADELEKAREELITRTGLLPPARSEDRAAFYHPSIQEFLTAQRIAELSDTPTKLLRVFLDHSRRPEWRPTLAFVFGRVLATATVSRSPRLLLTRLVRHVGSKSGFKSDTVNPQLVIANSFEILVRRGDRLKPVVEKCLRNAWLDTIRCGAANARDRCRLGDVLALVGDPRFRADAWYLPDDPMLGLVEVPAGPFQMGSDPTLDPQASRDEQPMQKVTLPTFYIARFPVTVAQFYAFVQDTGMEPRDPACLRGNANHPVVRVSWHESMAYSGWLTKKLAAWHGTPGPLRKLLAGERSDNLWAVTLPSESEWEKAARGTDGRIFPWGNTPDPNLANYANTGIGGTNAVGCFLGGASPYGVEEMSGNVWEWTRTRSPDSSGARVVRGGAFDFGELNLRAAFTGWYDPFIRNGYIGFRVAVSRLTPDL